MGPSFKSIDRETLDGLALDAAVDPRRRRALLLHETPEEPIQALVNVFLASSYVPPHRFVGRVQVFSVLRGRFRLRTWDRAEDQSQTTAQTPGAVVRLLPSVFHSWEALDDGAALLEVILGPYDPASKENLPDVPGDLDARGMDLLRKWKKYGDFCPALSEEDQQELTGLRMRLQWRVLDLVRKAPLVEIDGDLFRQRQGNAVYFEGPGGQILADMGVVMRILEGQGRIVEHGR